MNNVRVKNDFQNSVFRHKLFDLTKSSLGQVIKIIDGKENILFKLKVSAFPKE